MYYYNNSKYGEQKIGIIARAFQTVAHVESYTSMARSSSHNIIILYKSMVSKHTRLNAFV